MHAVFQTNYFYVESLLPCWIKPGSDLPKWNDELDWANVQSYQINKS